MQVMLGLVLLSFVFWYSKPNGDVGGVVARVNGETITDTEFTRTYRMAARQYGAVLSEAQEAQLRAQVRQQLIADEVLTQEAARLGLVVSDSEVARGLLNVRFLRDAEGKFDDRLYQSWLKNSGFTRTDHESYLRNQLLRQKLQRLVYMGASVSEAAARDYYVRTQTQLDVQFVRLHPSVFVPQVQVSPEEVETWIRENPERLRAEYDGDYARIYDLPEKVRWTVVRLDLKEDGLDLDALKARLAPVREAVLGGEPVETAQAKYSDQVGGNDVLMPVPSLDEGYQRALTGTEVGAVSELVVTAKSVAFFRLEERLPARVIPIEEAQAEIAAQVLRTERAPALAAQAAEELLAAWRAGGAVPAAWLAERGLQPTQTGPFLVGEGPSFSRPAASLVRAAETAEVGALLPEVYEEGGTLYVGALSTRTAPEMALWDSERAQIVDEALAVRRGEVFTAWQDDLIANADIL